MTAVPAARQRRMRRLGRHGLRVLATCIVLLLLPVASAQPGTGLTELQEQVHTTLADDGLVVQWAIIGVQYSQLMQEPQVQWSLDGQAQDPVAAEHVGTVVPRISGVSSDPDRRETYVYAATLPAPPGNTVEYSVGASTLGFRGPFTAEMPPDRNGTLRLVAFGDIGVDQTLADGSCGAQFDDDTSSVETDCPAHAVRDAAIAEDPHLVIIPGDLAYDNRRAGWDSFMRMMEPLQSTTPFMPVPGNHEHEDDVGYAQILNEYVLPGDEEFYLFRAGDVTFIGLNSDTVCGPGEHASGAPQDPCDGAEVDERATAWLDGALGQAASDETTWTVVFFHHPLYSFGRHGSSLTLQFLWEEMFVEHGVDLVVQSHDHLYSRSYPTVSGKPAVTGDHYHQGDGPIYVVTGGGGRDLYFIPEGEPPAWHAAGALEHHYTRFDIDSEAIRFEAINIDGEILDAFLLEQAHGEAGDGSGDEESPMAWIPLALALAVLAWRRR